MISLWVRELHFTNGDTDDLGPTDILVFVGPNSSGKSRFLADIMTMVSTDGTPKSVARGVLWLDDMGLEREGNAEDFKEWFEIRSRIAQNGAYAGNPVMGNPGGGEQQTLDIFWAMWQRTDQTGIQRFGQLAQHLVAYMPANERANFDLDSMPPRDPTHPPTDPIHFIWDDLEEEARFSLLIERAFGFGVCINRHQRNSMSLLKGSHQPGDDHVPPDRDVLDRYAAMPHVSQEGDGVKSFIHILLRAIKSKRRMIIVDEPETFLHPPQARLIGRLLVNESPPDAQVFMATHSSDVLQGVLDGRRKRPVKIIRLSREDGVHRRKLLPADRLDALWRDPLIRYSGILSGLFHEGLVICEADNDARFYSAVLEALLQKEQRPEHDLVFTHLGGKDRFARAMGDMRDFGVRTAVIGDIDVLDNVGKVKGLVKAAGGDYSLIAEPMRVISDNVRLLSGGPTVGRFRVHATPILKRTDDIPITREEKVALTDALKGATGWGQVQRGGISALAGGAPAHAQEVLEYLRKLGVFLVPVGDLERWFPMDVPKGSPYVNAVLEQGLHEKPTPELKEFMEQLAEFFGVGSPIAG